ncbi:uncharacterized protein ACDP82_002975 isoform 2-T2 [Pangshura tecta]
MISDLILATERLKTEKKYLNKMVTKLVEENQKFLGENRHFREKMASFQSSPVPRKRMVEEIDEMYLQQWEREMEDKKEEIIKEKHQISETRGTVAEQGKIIENLQTQINHLREELKNSELIACQPMEQKEVHSESPMHKVAKANLLEKLVNSCLSKRLSLLRKPPELNFKLLQCLFILLALFIFYTYFFHATWICQLLPCTCHRHYASCLRPH